MSVLFLFFLFSCAAAVPFDHISDNLCNYLHYDLEMRLLLNYFHDTFYMAVIDTDPYQDHRLNTLKCVRLGKHSRPFIIYNSIQKLIFKKITRNSSISTYTRVRGYFIKTNQYDAKKFLEKISKQNPMVKVLFQLTDNDTISEISNEILRVAFEKYKMLSVATLHRQVGFVSIKFYNPFKNNGEFQMINITRKSDLIKIKKFQHERIWNLNKYPIRIYIFESPIYVKSTRDKYTGSGAEMVNMLAEKLNFTPIYIVSNNEDSALYGFQLENGSFTGGIGAIENNQADLIMNARLISDLNTTRAIYLQPITTASYKFVIQRLKRQRRLPLSIFGFYDIPSKIIASLLLFSFPIIYMIVNSLERDLLKKNGECQPKRSLINYCVYMCALINNISTRQTHTAPPSSRIIIFVVMFYALFASSVFQGNIIRDLNAQTCVGRINDVYDLYNGNYSFIINHMLSEILMKQTGNELSRNLRKIAEKATVVSSEEGMKILLKEKKFACLLDTLYVSTNYLNRFYDNKTGENLLEVVPEKAFEFYVSIMAARDSPFLHPFNQYILKWIEAGFDSHHINRATNDNNINTFYEKHRKGLTFTRSNQFKSLSIDDLVSVFILYACLVIICIITFVSEVVYCFTTKTTNNFTAKIYTHKYFVW